MVRPDERFIGCPLGEQKNKSKPRLISHFDSNGRKFVIAKYRRVKYDKILGNALSANFRFERQRRRAVRDINELKKSIASPKDG